MMRARSSVGFHRPKSLVAPTECRECLDLPRDLGAARLTDVVVPTADNGESKLPECKLGMRTRTDLELPGVGLALDSTRDEYSTNSSSNFFLRIERELLQNQNKY